LIHDHQDPAGPQRGRFAPEDIILQRLSFMWPRKSARRDHRSPVPAGSDGPESCEPRLYRFGCGTPRPSVVRFADSPRWDYAASFRRPHGRALHAVLAGPASDGNSGEQHPILSLAHSFVKASRVEGFSTIAERSRRVGRTKSAIQPARTRPTWIDSAIVAENDSRLGAGA